MAGVQEFFGTGLQTQRDTLFDIRGNGRKWSSGLAASTLAGVAGSITWLPTTARVATTVAGTLASSFANGSTVDGVALATGDRILIKNQATGSENGIYTVNAAGAPTRATDFDSTAETATGTGVWITSGTTNANSGWVQVTPGAITVGTTSMVFRSYQPARLVFVGDSITEGLDASYVEAFKKRIGPYNGFKRTPGWVHASQDVAVIFSPYRFTLSAGTANSPAGQNIEDHHSLSRSGWKLASGSTISLRDFDGSASSATFDLIEVHYTVFGTAASAGSISVIVDGATVATYNTLDTSIGTGNYQCRTAIIPVARAVHTLDITGSGGQPSIVGGVYLSDQDAVWVYQAGNSGDEISDFYSSASGQPIQAAAAIDADCVLWMHGTNNFHAGDLAAAVQAATDLDTALVNTKAAVSDVSIGYAPPYPAQSRTTWPLFVAEWRRVCAKNATPVCDLSTMLKTNAATTDPFDLIDDGGSIANTHPNGPGAEYMADQIARFLGLVGIDWVAAVEMMADRLLGNPQTTSDWDTRAAVFYTPPFGNAVTLRSAMSGSTLAQLLLRHDNGSNPSTGTSLAQIGVNVRDDSGPIGSGATHVAYLRWVANGTILTTNRGTDLIFANVANGSASAAAERLRLIAGGGLLFPAGSLTSYLQNANVLATIPADKTSSFTFDANHGGASVGYNSASAGDGTIPPNSSVAYPIGTVLEARQRGAGQLTLVAGSGVTFETYPTGAVKTAGQYAAISAMKIATDTWSVQGGST